MPRTSLLLLFGLLAACHVPSPGAPCDTVGEGWCDEAGVPRYYCSAPAATPSPSPQWVAVNLDGLSARASLQQICQCLPDADSGRTRLACLATFHNQGGLCVNGDSRVDSVDPVAAGARLYIHIPAPSCISSSCTPVADRVRTHCRVQAIGRLLTVESDFVFEHPFEGLCTSDCRITYAECQSDPLPAGDYTIVHGSRSQSITLPSPGPLPPCRKL